LDKASELAKGNDKIGSTLKGIGPAYMDKTGRNGLRVGDLLSSSFDAQYKAIRTKHQQLLDNFNFTEDIQEWENEFFEAIELLRTLNVVNGEYFINDHISKGKKVLAEGAQGTMLDIDFGTFPFVTSSNTICAGACTGLGIAPNKIGNVIGIFKAYCTRVGSGPFPTELDDAVGEKIRKIGNEFGSTTGRSRRTGWLDLPALKYAVMINGVTELIMMKADVLSGFEMIKVCTKYNYQGKKIDYLPYDYSPEMLSPVYTDLKGWNQDLTGLNSPDQMPEALNDYIAFIERETGVPITIVSVGPDRTQTLIRKKELV